MLLLNQQAVAQIDTSSQHRLVSYTVETGGMGSTAGVTPFWLRSNRFGTVPLTGSFGFVRAATTGRFSKPTPGRFTLGYGVEVVANAGQQTQVLLPEAYIRAGFRQLEFFAGRRKQVVGLADTLLSSGVYAWSGNSLPIPKIQFGTNGFAPLAFTNGLVAINAHIAHGWFGNTGLVQGSFLHQKAIYVQIGKPRSRVKFLTGITHFAQWGGRTSAHDIGKNGQLPSSFKDYLYVVAALNPDPKDSLQYSQHDAENRFGNHLGSIDFAADIALPNASLFIYVQRPYDDDTGVLFMNMPDGLYGIRWQNRTAERQHGFRLQRLTAEFLTTLNQSGPILGGGHFQGADDYFNNYQYRDGWIYHNQIIGTPFFTRRVDASADHRGIVGGLIPLPISNNRVQVIHVGILGSWRSGAGIRALLSQSWNYGQPMRPDPILAYAQFSGLFEFTLPVHWLGGTVVRAAVAVDRGQWLPNSFGSWLSLQKIGLFTGGQKRGAQ